VAGETAGEVADGLVVGTGEDVEAGPASPSTPSPHPGTSTTPSSTHPPPHPSPTSPPPSPKPSTGPRNTPRTTSPPAPAQPDTGPPKPSWTPSGTQRPPAPRPPVRSRRDRRSADAASTGGGARAQRRREARGRRRRARRPPRNARSRRAFPGTPRAAVRRHTAPQTGRDDGDSPGRACHPAAPVETSPSSGRGPSRSSERARQKAKAALSACAGGVRSAPPKFRDPIAVRLQEDQQLGARHQLPVHGSRLDEHGVRRVVARLHRGLRRRQAQ